MQARYSRFTPPCRARCALELESSGREQASVPPRPIDAAALVAHDQVERHHLALGPGAPVSTKHHREREALLVGVEIDRGERAVQTRSARHMSVHERLPLPRGVAGLPRLEQLAIVALELELDERGDAAHEARQ